MDLGIRLVLLGGALMLSLYSAVSANYVFPVEHKFKGKPHSLSALRAHDARRHGRILSAVDLQLGGNGQPSEIGLYYTKLGIGSPSKNYYVQVDTGSDILWVNCAGCEKCPSKSNLGMKLILYDPKRSSTSKLVTCDQEFCTSTYNGRLPACRPELPCQYDIVYGDGSSTAGYFVKDTVHFDRVTGNHQTSSLIGSVVFGCGAKQSGELGSSSEALDGIVGFGQADSSMLSQLTSEGKVKKIFSHCLDNVNGGGVFAIGQVVQPQMSTTPIVPNETHYNIIMKHVEVDGDVLELSTDFFGTGSRRGTIIDSGTTLAYLPEAVYMPLMTKIIDRQPGLKIHTIEEQFSCFHYSGKVDDGFPVVKFHFEKSLNLTVDPHDYLFKVGSDHWCFGWQSSGMQSKDGKEVTLLGDLVFSNKLVLYDLEKQVLGWTEYNCSQGIKVKDESGAVYTVGAHNLSSASNLVVGIFFTFLLLLIAMLHSFTS